MKTVYVETSIFSYLTSRLSRDVRAAAWQQITQEWWESHRKHYRLYISELVVAEAAEGDSAAAQRRIDAMRGISEVVVDAEVQQLSARLIADGGFPEEAEMDALHVASAAVHGINLLLTWNCRHINNAETKPVIRAICAVAGYTCPEICTPMELLPEGNDHVSG